MANIDTTDPIYFNGNNLLNIPGWMTTGTDPYRYADKELKEFSIAYSDDTVITSSFFNGKKITINGVLKGLTRESLDESISLLYEWLKPQNKVLQLPISGEQRKYLKATVANVIIKDVAGGYADISIEFKSTQPYNYAVTNTTNLNIVNLTSGNKSYPILFEGRGEQAPVITYTVDSFTSGTNTAVEFINPLSNLSIIVERTWTAPEVLVIDCLNRTVKVNGVDTDFTGNFPKWNTGNGFLNYTDEFTARQVDISVTYTKRYL